MASLACGLTVAVGSQIPAHAGSYTHVDARHDVAKSPQDVRSPAYRKADVTRLQITHGAKAVKFTIRLRSASLQNVKFRSVGFTVKTPKHTFTGGWIAHPRADQYMLFDETGREITCGESNGRNGRTIWLRLDRACFGTPRWVRASVQVGTNNGSSAWEDNALSNDWRRASDVVFSPRIRPAT